MNNDQFQLFMTVLLRIADALERIAPATPKAPNYQYPIEQFLTFDWESIGAVVEKHDQYGAAVVSWGGRSFLRRSPANKYSAAIWFSCAVGKDGENTIYERLITFKPRNSNAEPIPEKVTNLISYPQGKEA
ncbi:single-stranded DNA-binding protein [Trichormus variabilis]|nr:single-stranded DNA-binding protein [Trichormus variabilis]